MKAITILFILLTTITACHSSTLNDEKLEIVTDQDLLNLVLNNDLPGVAKALERGGNVNATDKNKRSLLLIATSNAHIEMAKLLVKNGADVNQQSDNMDSAFLYAGAAGQTELHLYQPVNAGM
jgi:ankyrin repeat protein